MYCNHCNAHKVKKKEITETFPRRKIQYIFPQLFNEL